MKALCTGNHLSDLHLTLIHRAYFETRHFGAQSELEWRANPGRTYTVYGIKIVRGYPFYFVQRDYENPRIPSDWGFIPSLCFTVTDNRPSWLWRFASEVVDLHDGQIFVTKLAIAEWIDEPDFHLNLVEQKPREVAIMTSAAAFMDTEFD